MAQGTIKRPATPVVVDSGGENLTLPAGSIVTKDITFNKAFSSAPVVMLTILSSSSQVAGGTMIGVTLNAAPSRTGFTVRGFNSDTSQRAPNVRWLAIGT